MTTDRIDGLTPSVDEVAHRLWARTKTPGGQTLGTFNADTRPTDVIVREFIDGSVTEVLGFCPVLPEARWAVGKEACRDQDVHEDRGVGSA